MCIPNLDEISQSTVEIKLLPVWENGRPPYWISISCQFWPVCSHRHVILHQHAKFCEKVKICLHTKFRWDISIHGWDKTTYGFGKRTAAILEFYFRFRPWPKFSPPHVILLQPAKFCSNPTTGGGDMTSYRFFKMAAIISEIYFRVQVS